MKLVLHHALIKYCLLLFFVAQESDLITHIFSIQNLTNGVDQLCVSISVYDDRKLEGDETFFVRLIKFPDESLILGSKTEKTVTIIDNGQ